jgi:hypothetical protein
LYRAFRVVFHDGGERGEGLGVHWLQREHREELLLGAP